MEAPGNLNLDTVEEQARLLDLARDAILVRDLNGVIRYWNHGAERLYGWSKEEALGQPIQILLKTKYPLPVAQIEAAALAAGEWEGELEHTRRDGSTLIVNSRWVLRQDAAGKPTSILQSNTDVTLHRQAEDAVRRSEAKFRALLESAPDAMIIVDEQGRIALANRRTEQTFGYTAQELQGLPVEVLIPARFHAAHRDHRAAYAHDPQARPMGSGLELAARRKDGSEIPVEVSLSPLRIEKHLLVTAAIRDITERKRAEAALNHVHDLELAQAEHLANLGEIAAGLAHEIKNPLAGIAAALEVLAGQFGGEREIMAEVRQQVERIRGIVDDLLHYARPRPPQMELGNLNLAVARAVHLAALGAKLRGVRVTLTPGSLPPLRHDPEQVERMVANLVLNAIEAAPDQGRVEITTGVAAAPAAAAKIEVRDNGAGIPAAQLAQIFRPFFTTKGERGNGLGLPMCRRIAEMHGGRVEVHSQVGRGSTFTILLPLAAATQTDETAHSHH